MLEALEASSEPTAKRVQKKQKITYIIVFVSNNEKFDKRLDECSVPTYLSTGTVALMIFYEVMSYLKSNHLRNKSDVIFPVWALHLTNRYLTPVPLIRAAHSSRCAGVDFQKSVASA